MKKLWVERNTSTENSRNLDCLAYGHFRDPSHQNGRFVVCLECKNIKYYSTDVLWYASNILYKTSDVL